MTNHKTSRPTMVIDTNVFMGAGADVFSHYSNCNIVIPLAVIQELEEHRSDPGGIGKACCTVLQHIENLRRKNGINGNIVTGIRDGENTVRVKDYVDESRTKGDEKSAVIATARSIAKTIHNVTVVSNNLATRLVATKCATIYEPQMKAEPYEVDFQPFSGWFELKDVDIDNPPNNADVNSALLQQIECCSQACGQDELPGHAAIRVQYTNSSAHGLPEYFILDSPGNLRPADGSIRAGNIFPRQQNMDQTIALEYLMDPRIQVVTLGGIAGSGKSMLALAAGMAQLDRHDNGATYNREQTGGQYERIIVFRSMVEMAQQKTGFLPGDLEEKMAPWAQAVWDNVAQIDRINSGRRKLLDLQAVAESHRGSIEVSPVSFLRGRTISNSFIVVDDAQSLDRTTLLDIIARLGKRSKIVFTFDLAQQDNRFISTGTSILSVINDLLCHRFFAHISFTKSERSELAQLAGDLLTRDL